MSINKEYNCWLTAAASSEEIFCSSLPAAPFASEAAISAASVSASFSSSRPKTLFEDIFH